MKNVHLFCEVCRQQATILVFGTLLCDEHANELANSFQERMCDKLEDED